MGRGIKGLLVGASRRAPLPVIAPLVNRRVRKLSADPQTVAVARRQMEYVLGVLRPDADLDAVALQHIEDTMWRRELRWRTRAMLDQRVEGIENLAEYQPEHGGLMMVFLHHGRYDGIFGALVRAGARRMQIAAGTGMFGPETPPHLLAMGRTVEHGGTMASVALGYAGLRDHVLAGETVAVALDLPGSTRIRFLGRDLKAASGTARIAMETQTPVVAVTAWRDEQKLQRIRVSEPLRPADHSDAAALLQALFDELEPSVLAWPEAYEWPRAHFIELDAHGDPIHREPDPGEPTFA